MSSELDECVCTKGSTTNKPWGDAETSCFGSVTSEEKIYSLASGAAFHSKADTEDEDLSLEWSDVDKVAKLSDSVTAWSFYTLNPIDPTLSE